MMHPPTTNDTPQMPIIDQEMLDMDAQNVHKPAVALRMTSISKEGQRIAVGSQVYNYAGQVLVVLMGELMHAYPNLSFLTTQFGRAAWSPQASSFIINVPHCLVAPIKIIGALTAHTEDDHYICLNGATDYTAGQQDRKEHGSIGFGFMCARARTHSPHATTHAS